MKIDINNKNNMILLLELICISSLIFNIWLVYDNHSRLEQNKKIWEEWRAGTIEDSIRIFMRDCSETSYINSTNEPKPILGEVPAQEAPPIDIQDETYLVMHKLADLRTRPRIGDTVVVKGEITALFVNGDLIEYSNNYTKLCTAPDTRKQYILDDTTSCISVISELPLTMGKQKKLLISLTSSGFYVKKVL